MRPSRPRPLLAIFLAALVAGACRSNAPPALTAAGLTFEEGELVGLSPERRRLLGELTAFGVAVADSALDALGGPRVTARERDRLWELLQARAVLDSAGVGDDVLEARYRTSPDFELEVRHLIVLSPRYEREATRALAREKAERALARIRAGEPFPTVAAEVSEEPGAQGREGLLAPGREGSWVDEFWRAASGLEPGEVSGVVETRYGFHVLRLEARRTVPFDEARARTMVDVARMMADLDPSAASAALPEGFALERAGLVALGAPGSDGSAVVARWPGGELTADTLRAALAADGWVAAGPPPADERVERQARAIAAGRRAAAAGLAVPEGWRADARREWRQRAEAWASLFGFAPTARRADVRAAATRALGARGQNATVARDELHRDAAGLLHHAYAIEVRGDETPAGGGA